jgi:hypothetical protein
MYKILEIICLVSKRVYREGERTIIFKKVSYFQNSRTIYLVY